MRARDGEEADGMRARDGEEADGMPTHVRDGEEASASASSGGAHSGCSATAWSCAGEAHEASGTRGVRHTRRQAHEATWACRKHGLRYSSKPRKRSGCDIVSRSWKRRTVMGTGKWRRPAIQLKTKEKKGRRDEGDTLVGSKRSPRFERGNAVEGTLRFEKKLVPFVKAQKRLRKCFPPLAAKLN